MKLRVSIAAVAAALAAPSHAQTAVDYDKLAHDALSYFYHNRAGTPIEARFVGQRWARPAGHAHERATCVSGVDSAVVSGWRSHISAPPSGVSALMFGLPGKDGVKRPWPRAGRTLRQCRARA